MKWLEKPEDCTERREEYADAPRDQHAVEHIEPRPDDLQDVGDPTAEPQQADCQNHPLQTTHIFCLHTNPFVKRQEALTMNAPWLFPALAGKVISFLRLLNMHHPMH